MVTRATRAETQLRSRRADGAQRYQTCAMTFGGGRRFARSSTSGRAQFQVVESGFQPSLRSSTPTPSAPGRTYCADVISRRRRPSWDEPPGGRGTTVNRPRRCATRPLVTGGRVRAGRLMSVPRDPIGTKRGLFFFTLAIRGAFARVMKVVVAVEGRVEESDGQARFGDSPFRCSDTETERFLERGGGRRGDARERSTGVKGLPLEAGPLIDRQVAEPRLETSRPETHRQPCRRSHACTSMPGVDRGPVGRHRWK